MSLCCTAAPSQAMDARIMRHGIISSCQSAATSEIVKSCCSCSSFVSSAIASTQTFTFRPPFTFWTATGSTKHRHKRAELRAFHTFIASASSASVATSRRPTYLWYVCWRIGLYFVNKVYTADGWHRTERISSNWYFVFLICLLSRCKSCLFVGLVIFVHKWLHLTHLCFV